LLFLDEVRACPPAMAALRCFFELMPDLNVIAGTMAHTFINDLLDLPKRVSRADSVVRLIEGVLRLSRIWESKGYSAAR
jgi:hypothetical protein